ncbi:MAG: acyl carrier protein [Bacteroidota bacterium]
MNKIPESLQSILQVVCEDKAEVLTHTDILPQTNLRNDLQLDSLELAELSVRIEDAFGVDVFQGSQIECIGDILQKLEE